MVFATDTDTGTEMVHDPRQVQRALTDVTVTRLATIARTGLRTRRSAMYFAPTLV